MHPNTFYLLSEQTQLALLLLLQETTMASTVHEPSWLLGRQCCWPLFIYTAFLSHSQKVLAATRTQNKSSRGMFGLFWFSRCRQERWTKSEMSGFPGMWSDPPSARTTSSFGHLWTLRSGRWTPRPCTLLGVFASASCFQTSLTPNREAREAVCGKTLVKEENTLLGVSRCGRDTHFSGHVLVGHIQGWDKCRETGNRALVPAHLTVSDGIWLAHIEFDTRESFLVLLWTGLCLRLYRKRWNLSTVSHLLSCYRAPPSVMRLSYTIWCKAERRCWFETDQTDWIQLVDGGAVYQEQPVTQWTGCNETLTAHSYTAKHSSWRLTSKSTACKWSKLTFKGLFCA